MTFELGVNYWPRRRAMYMWREFDFGEVREDMSRIADLGFDVVRLLTLTEDFLPEPMTVDARMVARLVDVARELPELGLSRFLSGREQAHRRGVWRLDLYLHGFGRVVDAHRKFSELDFRSVLRGWQQTRWRG